MPKYNTYEKIASYTFPNSSSASYTFTSVPSTFTHLIMTATLKGTSTNYASIYMRVGNGGSADSGSNYSQLTMYGTGSGANSERINSGTSLSLNRASGYSSDEWGAYEINLLGYTNANQKTAFVAQNTLTTGAGKGTERYAGMWNNTATVDTITIGGNGSSNNIASGSIVTLYGIKAAS
jgi:hypothetical protein